MVCVKSAGSILHKVASWSERSAHEWHSLVDWLIISWRSSCQCRTAAPLIVPRTNFSEEVKTKGKNYSGWGHIRMHKFVWGNQILLVCSKCGDWSIFCVAILVIFCSKQRAKGVKCALWCWNSTSHSDHFALILCSDIFSGMLCVLHTTLPSLPFSPTLHL